MRFVIFAAGTYILLPVAVLFAVLWLFDTLRTHAELRDAEQSASIPADWRPDIPKCDKPLWDRVKDRCAEEEDNVGS